MGVFDRQAAQALKQITAKGEPCVWNDASVNSAVDPSTPWISVKTESIPQPVSILFTGNKTKLVSGVNVQTNTIKAIMPAYTFVPDMKDTVTRSDGTMLELDSISSLAPNGQVILWYLEFKK